MGYMSEREYSHRMKSIQMKNKTIERKMKLREERMKYSWFHSFLIGAKTSNKILALAIVAVTWFTASSLFIQYTTQMEVNGTLTTLWFSFWTVEIVSLAGIKVSKVIKNTDSQDIEQNIDDGSCG